MAALLHDIADWKKYGGDESVGPRVASEWLEKIKVEKPVIDHIAEIIKEISFKGAGEKSLVNTKEGKIVQDADRLDAIGAIGIARTFAFGGKNNQEIYNPEIKPKENLSKEEYEKQYTNERKSTTINHFYEKLLLLKDLMNTSAGREIAEKRHEYLEEFLEEFFDEWEGKR